MRESERRRLELLGELDEKEDGEVHSNEQLPLEKHDFMAMWLSGIFVIGLPILIVITIVTVAVLLIFT